MGPKRQAREAEINSRFFMNDDGPEPTGIDWQGRPTYQDSEGNPISAEEARRLGDGE